MSQCRNCGKAVYWCKTNTGKIMPVDAEPSEDGNIILERNALGQVANVLNLADLATARAQGKRLHKSHFVTCPNAANHRKAKEL